MRRSIRAKAAGPRRGRCEEKGEEENKKRTLFGLEGKIVDLDSFFGKNKKEIKIRIDFVSCELNSQQDPSTR